VNVINQFKLDNKIAIVTGGYSYLGKYFVEALLEAGATVIIAGRDLGKCKNTVKKMKEKNSEYLIEYLEIDISNTDSIKKCFEKIYIKFKRIDILVNNAVYSKHNTLEDMTDEEWNYGVDGTLNSVFRCVREVTPYMKKQKEGNIVNISSMYGMVSPDFKIYKNDLGLSNPPNYGAAKSGVIQLTKYCAVYLAKYGIRVNCISPGPFPSYDVQKNEEFIDRLSSKVPLGRIGKPEELKGALIFLASEASSYITGHNLIVDGGWTIW